MSGEQRDETGHIPGCPAWVTGDDRECECGGADPATSSLAILSSIRAQVVVLGRVGITRADLIERKHRTLLRDIDDVIELLTLESVRSATTPRPSRGEDER